LTNNPKIENNLDKFFEIAKRKKFFKFLEKKYNLSTEYVDKLKENTASFDFSKVKNKLKEISNMNFLFVFLK
jgi:hypothetical protein